MSASSIRDLENAIKVQSVRAQNAEQKAADIQHALNLVLNCGFERFHLALSAGNDVHWFELGTVTSCPSLERLDLPAVPKKTRTRRIVLWTTMFSEGHHYASAFHELEFRSLPKHFEPGNELRNLLEEAIEKIPTAKPFLIKGDSGQSG